MQWVRDRDDLVALFNGQTHTFASHLLEKASNLLPQSWAFGLFRTGDQRLRTGTDPVRLYDQDRLDAVSGFLDPLTLLFFLGAVIAAAITLVLIFWDCYHGVEPTSKESPRVSVNVILTMHGFQLLRQQVGSQRSFIYGMRVALFVCTVGMAGLAYV